MAESLPFDRVADSYDETRGGEQRGRQFAAALAPHLLPGRVLEIGVGTGLVAAALAQVHGVPAVGVDLSPAMLTHAHTRLGARVAVGDARGLPVRDAAVDNAFFAGALHVIVDVDAAFAEAARVVRPGGRVLALSASSDRDRHDVFAPLLEGLPGRDRVDLPDAVLAAATEAGLRTRESREVTVGAAATSPNQIAETIETRAWSYLWNVDGAVWVSTVMPIVQGLRDLPDPDEPRDRRLTFQLSVFEKP
ncbi:Methyltransferase domain-containing protein [Asanoa hainanensis]|uniref:Methyltransferase domain-containing protein n=1 Tax=Asanoa hainanensis TaxID=560556 RepID=A0A239NHA2_9ACTN|nr:methyltransferase domain-containing protein [Asanoa hainanensis]SNT53499.1 Methyltransferase domain-containing protein [Asanoa hainanensis]